MFGVYEGAKIMARIMNYMSGWKFGTDLCECLCDHIAKLYEFEDDGGDGSSGLEAPVPVKAVY